MVDISKCSGEGCDKKETCWRYLAPSSSWQSFMNPDPKDCDHYWHTPSVEEIHEIYKDEE